MPRPEILSAALAATLGEKLARIGTRIGEVTVAHMIADVVAIGTQDIASVEVDR
jgi:hypothetical protein